MNRNPLGSTLWISFALTFCATFHFHCAKTNAKAMFSLIFVATQREH